MLDDEILHDGYIKTLSKAVHMFANICLRALRGQVLETIKNRE